MKRAALYIALLAAVAGAGYAAWNDKDVQRLISPPATNSPVSTSNTLVAPTFTRDLADAFCRGDAAAVYAATEMEGVTEEMIEYYFSADPACLGVRYLGQLVDGGVRRYIYVLDFEAGRTDWIVFTVNEANKLTTFDRG